MVAGARPTGGAEGSEDRLKPELPYTALASAEDSSYLDLAVGWTDIEIDTG